MSQYGMIDTKYDEQNGFLPPAPKKHGEKMTFPIVAEFIFVTTVIGAAIYGFEKFSELYVYLIRKTPLMDYYMTSEAAFNAVQTLFSMFAILPPFGAAYIILKLFFRDGMKPYPFGFPAERKFFSVLIIFAFGALIVDNFAVGSLTLFLEELGFEFESGGGLEPPESVGGFFMQIISMAVVPALCEEFAIRGVVLQILRRYGDGFAIVASAVIFGIIHGDATQALFAIIIGMIIAWAVIKTDSLWTGIAIHFLNNTYAVILTALYNYVSLKTYIAIAVIFNFSMIIVALFSLIWIVEKKKSKIIPEGKYSWRPYAVACVSPVFAIMVFYFLRECFSTVTYVGIS